MRSLIDGKTAILLIGNPGVGKSSILNTLGGNFLSGYSCTSGLTTYVSKQDVIIDQKPYRLVDMPGIYDSAKEGSSSGDSVTDNHLKMLREALNDGHAYVIFFVISPRNGRVDPSDLAMMQLVLEKMDNGPTVGLIITQIKARDLIHIQSPTYFSRIIQIMKNNNADLRFLTSRGPLVLRDHDEGFSDDDRYHIRSYITKFTPRQVQIRNMIATALRMLLKLLKMIIFH
ncbi:hypothetical protein EMPS_09415 [Entomortierella parvispora]|uniref:G domain-containing protein n=1 Tax=Entomortierella parvispora TaxID=205924 RepID=A0A9P3HI65_9FUNG|nr:hypothetical protein EMPS_09415 [Entomortierella parvispora]